MYTQDVYIIMSTLYNTQIFGKLTLSFTDKHIIYKTVSTFCSNGPLEETAYNIPTFPLRDKLTNNNQAIPMFSELSVTSEGSNPNTTNTTNKLCNVIKAKRILCITCVLLIIVIPGVLTFILALAKKM